MVPGLFANVVPPTWTRLTKEEEIMAEAKKLRWGVVSSGRICQDFVSAVQLGGTNSEIIAVCSRTQAAADEFGKKYGIPNCYPTLLQLVQDPNVDAVYVGTPHPYHKESVEVALQNGKHVLCEKPFTLNHHDLTGLVSLAAEKKLFLMEGMWTRFFPATKAWSQLVKSGGIGEVRSLTCSFGYFAEEHEIGRLIDPNLGGGALLDVGVYLVALSMLVFGKPPSTIVSNSRMKNSVDIQTSVVFGYEDGQALLSCGFGSPFYKNEMELLGTAGSIRVPNFWCPTEYTVETKDGAKKHEFPLPENKNEWNFMNSIGLSYEVKAFESYVAEGKVLEAAEIPLTESIAVLKIMDTIREQIGLVYPHEKK